MEMTARNYYYRLWPHIIIIITIIIIIIIIIIIVVVITIPYSEVRTLRNDKQLLSYIRCSLHLLT
jgi:hypothetical protein